MVQSPEKLAFGDGRLQQEGGGAGRLVRERRCVRGRGNPSGWGEEMCLFGNRWVGLRNFLVGWTRAGVLSGAWLRGLVGRGEHRSGAALYHTLVAGACPWRASLGVLVRTNHAGVLVYVLKEHINNID